MNYYKNYFRTILVAVIFMLLANLPSTAQTKRAGLKGGLNISNLYIENVTDENARLGFHVGVYGQLFSS